MMKLFVLLITVVCFPLSVSAMELSGKLVYVSGNELCSLDLHTFKRKSILTGAIVNSSIAKTDNVEFVIVSDQGILKEVNIETGVASNIAKGRMASYLGKHKALFYYKKEEDGREWLVVKHGDKEQKIQESPLPFSNKYKKDDNKMAIYNEYIQKPAVAISENVILFVGENRNLWTYNFETKIMKDTMVTNCIPHAFRTKTGHIICEEFAARKYSLLSLEDNSVETLPIPEHSASFAYIPANDLLVYSTTKWKFPLSERYPVEIYNFSTSKIKEILNDQIMQSAIWIETR